MAGTPKHLQDLGERRIVSELLAARYADNAAHFGDDCAILAETEHGTLVATTDPAPRPVAWSLGFEDYYYWGWLLAAINLSDLAAAGGEPVGLLTSLTLPTQFGVADFNRLLDGIDDCCQSVQTHVVGGNLKESTDSSIRCEATAVGWVAGGRALSRRGASPGDLIVAFGPTGSFWAAKIAISRDHDVAAAPLSLATEILLRPRPQVAVASALRQRGLVRSACDASDGLYAAVRSLTTEQGLGARLQIDNWDFPAITMTAAKTLAVDPVRLALGFGDLQFVASVAAGDLSEVLRVATNSGVHAMVMGEVSLDDDVYGIVDRKLGVLANFDNERFSGESQFTAGLDSYEQRLLTRPLFRG